MGSDRPVSESSGDGVGHEPVLLEASLAALAPQPGDTAIDLTLGRGGHAAALLERIGPGGRLVGFDRDAENLAFAGRRLAAMIGVEPPPIEAIRPPTAPEASSNDRLRLIHADFAHAGEALAARGIAADLVLADLGVASTHFDDAARGFSFRFEGPLDMRLDRSRGVTAAELVASLPEDELARMIRLLGEEPLAARIARKIACVRESAPISTTSELAELVRAAYGPRARRSRMHPATRTFMALRIAVNDELGSLQRLLASIEEAARAIARGEPTWLRPGAGRGDLLPQPRGPGGQAKPRFTGRARPRSTRRTPPHRGDRLRAGVESPLPIRQASGRHGRRPSTPPPLESAWMPVHDA